MPEKKKITGWTNVWRYGSPRVALIRAQYARAGLEDWDNERVASLCRRLNVTLHDLAAMAGEYQKAPVNRYWAANYWPVFLAIHFDRVERAAKVAKVPIGSGISAFDMAAVKLTTSRWRKRPKLEPKAEPTKTEAEPTKTGNHD